jgi:hypothetical protein
MQHFYAPTINNELHRADKCVILQESCHNYLRHQVRVPASLNVQQHTRSLSLFCREQCNNHIFISPQMPLFFKSPLISITQDECLLLVHACERAAPRVPRSQLAQPPRLIKQTQKYLTTLKVCLRVPFVAAQTLIAAARKFISARIRMPLCAQRGALTSGSSAPGIHLYMLHSPRGLIAQLKAAHRALSVRPSNLRSGNASLNSNAVHIM